MLRLFENHKRVDTEALALIQRVAQVATAALTKEKQTLDHALHPLLQRKAADAMLPAMTA